MRPPLRLGDFAAINSAKHFRLAERPLHPFEVLPKPLEPFRSPRQADDNHSIDQTLQTTIVENSMILLRSLPLDHWWPLPSCFFSCLFSVSKTRRARLSQRT